MIVNGGIYAETITLPANSTLEVTGPDAPQTVQINSLSGGATESVIIEGSSELSLGAGTISGVISGSGDLRKFGAGTLTLDGPAPNTLTGDMFMDDGVLVLGKTSGPAIPGDISFGDGTGQPYIRTTQDNQFAPTSNMTFDNPSGQWSRFELQGTQQTLNSITAPGDTGAVIQNSESGVGGAGELVVNSGTFYGHMRNGNAGTLSLTKEGAGTLEMGPLPGGNRINYTGPTTVNGGQLRLVNLDGSTVAFELTGEDMRAVSAGAVPISARQFRQPASPLQTRALPATGLHLLSQW